ncbi:hypothetical protein F183_A42120 [Bryobacterales bacterium F-183]|nr:hypothetical protein F183_A42120 [Bryobacterales bacterium F-183]
MTHTIAAFAAAVCLLAQQDQNPVSERMKELEGLVSLTTEIKAALSNGNLSTARQLAGELSPRIDRYVTALKLDELERQLPAAGPDRIYPVAYAANAAFAAQDYTKAQAYARDLLSLAQQYPQDPYQGTATFYGHMVAGRVALARDRDLRQATASLLASAQTTGSPVLRSFGPNMSLAQDLLAAGQRDAVLQFFAQCSTFWSHTQAKQSLREWTEVVKGCCRMPNFGANLTY